MSKSFRLENVWSNVATAPGPESSLPALKRAFLRSSACGSRTSALPKRYAKWSPRPWGEGKLKGELSKGFRERVAQLLASSEDLTMVSTWEMEQEGSETLENRVNSREMHV